MFTGLVQALGQVQSRQPTDHGVRLTIEQADLPSSVSPGDSVCISGVCLTAIEVDGETLKFDVIPQTLELTKLGQLSEGDRVNLELAVAAGQPMGGHFMQGHVDAMGQVVDIDTKDGQWRVAVQPPTSLFDYLTPQGSIALDGVSLTLASVQDDRFEVALIPETLERTTLRDLRVGSPINIEADMLAKTVIHQWQRQQRQEREASSISMQSLADAGFHHSS